MNYKEFFYFQKSDRSVLIVLLSVVVIVTGALYGIGGRRESTPFVQADSTLVEERAHPAEKMERHVVGERAGQVVASEERVVERFPFDPNTADSSQLLRLGLQPWQVRSIYKYRAKGGVYREPKDFARLYGLTVKQYRELEPYIRISDDYRPASTLLNEEYRTKNEESVHAIGSQSKDSPFKKLREGERVDLCYADTSMLKRVPGIGSYYAREIMRYGERLGGYVRVDQLKEIEDLPEEVYPYFTLSNAVVRKMNVNKLTLSQLIRHPYLNFYQARAILDYRRLRGPLTNIDELSVMKEFSHQDIERLRPYIEF